jgi:hypothetical protein
MLATETPLFIVGLPRSGTKLIRDILNNHSKVKISSIETNFLSYLHSLTINIKNLENKENFCKFYNKIIKTTYFLYLRNQNKKIIDKDYWYNQCKEFTSSEIFKILILHDMNINFNNDFIWGDKSPQYITQIKLIKELYPNAKILHIVRDVRDVCLSSRKAWGRNIFGTAYRWNNELNKFNLYIKKFENDVHELSYENLLERPKEEIEAICNFLQIEYELGMESLKCVTENIGDAKNMKKIKKDNSKKFLTKFSSKEIKKIESLSYDYLKLYGYDIIYQNIEKKSLSKFELLYYYFCDFLFLQKFRIKNEGILFTLRFNLYSFKTSLV